MGIDNLLYFSTTLKNFVNTYSLDKFPFTKQMVEKNDFSKHNVCFLKEFRTNLLCAIAITEEKALNAKIKSIEVIENLRRRKIGSELIQEIKNENVSIELNSTKEAEDFYYYNGFSKVKGTQSSFIWVHK